MTTAIPPTEWIVRYRARWEHLPSGIYFMGYSLPPQLEMKHRTDLHFDTYSDLKEYVFDHYGSVRSIEPKVEHE